MTPQESIIAGLAIMMGAGWALTVPNSWGPFLFGAVYIMAGLWKHYRKA